jgi:hypothetical protein
MRRMKQKARSSLGRLLALPDAPARQMRLDRIRSLARSGPGSSEAQDESWQAWRFGNSTLEILFHQAAQG